jgi:two-component system OmpR family sensor kinase
MTRPARGVVLALLVPLLGGAVLGVILQAADPRIRLYVAASPGLVAIAAGLLGTAAAAIVVLARRRAASAAAVAAAAASAAAIRQVAEEAARDRLRFFMRLDHELKNPLTAIRAGLANIEQGGGMALASAGTVAALASVSVQADRIARLVGDLRKLADLETQQIEMAPVANAVKFSAPGDTVEVRASEDSDELLLEVADTGAGIPADEIGQVWQELARGRAARSLPGTGIGLALVRVIVVRHGGQVAIRSRDGQGTVVGIRLPVPDRARIAPDVATLRQGRDTPGMAAV